MTDELALAVRSGLPDPLRLLVERYPRIGWEAHPNFTMLTRFWLDRHLGFRRMQAMLVEDTRDFLDRGEEPRVYAGRLYRVAARLIDELHGHHSIEDHHYFPLLQTLDPGIAWGFDLLERDHEALDGLIHGLAEGTNGVLAAVHAGAPAETAAGGARRPHRRARPAARPPSGRRGGAGGAGDPRSPGGRALMLVSLLSAGNFVIGMGAFVILGMLSPMAQGLGMSSGEAGHVLTVYALAYAVSSPLAVAATGRLSRRTVLAGGMALFGLAALGSALAPSAGTLYAARILGALGAGVYTPIAASVAAAASAPGERGRALSRVFFGLTLAQVLGVPVGSFLAYSFGWRTSFLAVAVLAAPCVVALVVLVPARLAFQSTRLASLAATLGDWRTMLAVAFTITYLAPIYVVFTYLAPLLETTMGFGRNGITAAFLALGIGAVVGNLVGGRLSDRIGPGPTLVGIAVAQVALLPLFSTLPIPAAMFFALAFVWTSCGWSLIAPQQARLIRIAPDAQAVVLALNAAAIYLGAAGGSAVGAAVLARFGVRALGVAAGAMALAGVAHIVLARALRPRNLPSTI